MLWLQRPSTVIPSDRKVWELRNSQRKIVLEAGFEQEFACWAESLEQRTYEEMDEEIKIILLTWEIISGLHTL